MNKLKRKTNDISKNLKSNNPFKVISLFSGCGGKDLGVLGGFEFLGQQYGTNDFEIVFSNDIDSRACETYNFNFQHKANNSNIEVLDDSVFPPGDIVIGGFPCQDFSVAGNRMGFSSTRGLLYLQMRRVIQKVKPLVFVAENVEGISNLNGKNTLNKIISDLEKVGYHVEHRLLNAADYGVPQSRKRIFIIGFRNDIDWDKKGNTYPESTHSSKWLTAKDGIDDLWEEIDTGNFYNHSIKDFSKAKFYPGKKMQGNNRISPDKPAPTIRAEHHGNIEAHYRTYDSLNDLDTSKWRRLSVREAARLQSFPDDFVFPVSASSAYRQIGNAVPPVLAWYLFRHLNKILTNHKFIKSEGKTASVQLSLDLQNDL
jgi:DNA (cytosine-5)-methyltransferase 1